MSFDYFRSVVVRAFIVALCFLLVGCWKKESSVDLTKSETLASIPPNTLGLLYWNTDLPGYKRFKDSSWSKTQLPLESIPHPELKKVAAVLSRVGLLSSATNEKESINEGVIFITENSDPNGGLDVGLYARSIRGTDLAQLLERAKTELSNEGITLTDASTAERTGFSLTLHPPLSPYPDKFYLTAKGDKFAAGSDIAVVDAFYGPPPQAPPSILKSPRFKDILEHTGETSAYMMGTIDLYKALPVLSRILDKDLSNVPVVTVSYSKGYKEALTDELYLEMDPKTDQQSLALKSLSTSSGTELLKMTPGQILFSLQIDGKTLAELARHNGIDPALYGGITSKISRIAVIGRNGSVGSLFPGVTTLVESSDASELAAKLSKEIQTAASASGLPFSPWKEADIDGTKVSYSLTPLGVGIYLGVVNGFTVISTTEEGIRQIISVDDSQPSLYATLKKRDTLELATRPNVSSGHLNFIRIADALKELQGSLAMFSGGNSGVNEDSVTRLKELGEMEFSVTRDGSTLVVKTSYSRSK